MCICCVYELQTSHKEGSVWRVSECDNRISDTNFLIKFHSYSTLLGFRDMDNR